MRVEEGKTVQRLILEKNEEAELAKRLLEKIFHELANAHNDAQFARKDADVAKVLILFIFGLSSSRQVNNMN